MWLPKCPHIGSGWSGVRGRGRGALLLEWGQRALSYIGADGALSGSAPLVDVERASPLDPLFSQSALPG